MALLTTQHVQEMLQDVPAVDSKKLAPNPLDEKYSTLKADLELVPKDNKTYKIIETYFKNTTNTWRNVKLENVWSVDGEKDGGEFLQKSAKLGNRKLLWHGTNVAVVAAIMKGGLRIMPHSGMLPRLVFFFCCGIPTRGYMPTQRLAVSCLHETMYK